MIPDAVGCKAAHSSVENTDGAQSVEVEAVEADSFYRNPEVKGFYAWKTLAERFNFHVHNHVLTQFHIDPKGE